MQKYFTDREKGVRPRNIDVIDQRLWAGLYSLIDTRLGDGSFGYRFPAECPDRHISCGCDREAFRLVLSAEVPDIEWPIYYDELPETPVILDLLEFCAFAVGDPIKGSYHPHFQHYHLSWDRENGLAQFVEDVNTQFMRNGIAYELTEEGRVCRVLPKPLAEVLGSTQYTTGDDETDNLLETASRKILLPKSEDRRDAIEKLWDAFERLKTLEPGVDKRTKAEALLERVAESGTSFRSVLEEEMKTLTKIGNSFRIRHSETTQETLSSLEQVDYLFERLFAFVRMVLRTTDRGG